MLLWMNIKGICLLSSVKYVTSVFGDAAYQQWSDGLKEETQRKLRFTDSSSWYPIDEMFLLPGRRLCELFHSSDVEGGARAWGHFAATCELTGIYKLLLKIGSPGAMIAVSNVTWKTFYDKGALLPILNEDGRAVLRTRDVPITDPIWGHYASGWLEEALFLTGEKNGSVSVTHKMDDFEFSVRW
jgi:hypothetical protein